MTVIPVSDLHNSRNMVAQSQLIKKKGVGVWDGHVYTAIFKMGKQQGPTE